MKNKEHKKKKKKEKKKNKKKLMQKSIDKLKKMVYNISVR